jgi:hypothetical protein
LLEKLKKRDHPCLAIQTLAHVALGKEPPDICRKIAEPDAPSAGVATRKLSQTIDINRRKFEAALCPVTRRILKTVDSVAWTSNLKSGSHVTSGYLKAKGPVAKWVATGPT